MTLFLDTAKIEHIKHILSWAVVKGLTTNQAIFLKSGRKHEDFTRTVKEICDLVKMPVSIELTQTLLDDHALISEAMSLCEISEWVNIKVPMWGDGRGLVIIKELKEKRIKVNATCMMNAIQGVLAAEAGADYVSLFYGRINDYHQDGDAGKKSISTLRKYLDDHELSSQIIAGSMRKPRDVFDCLKAGAHIVTVPYAILVKLPFHLRTESTIRDFDDAWREFVNK